MCLKLLTMGGQTATTAGIQTATASSASVSPIFLAVLVGIALGAFVFAGICKIGIPKNAERNEKYYLQGIYRFLAVICLIIVISACIGLSMAISTFI